MEFFKTGTRIPFMKQRLPAAIFSVCILLASIVILVANGLNLGLDFTGGTQVDVQLESLVSLPTVRQNLAEVGFPEAVVQAYSSTHLSVRFGVHEGVSSEVLRDRLLTAMPKGTQISELQYIGPQIGKTLMTNGILAILVSLLGTMIYIALRFDYRFALSAAVALVHDPLLILGIFALFQLDFNLIVLAAVLTVIGFSLNDTVVVYDRVRENFRKLRHATPNEVMDLSINQTLSRTIMTSGLTLVVVVVLYLFGGQTVHNFSLALIIGIVIGTYSSIYIAGSFAIALGLNRQSLLVEARTNDDGRPQV